MLPDMKSHFPSCFATDIHLTLVYYSLFDTNTFNSMFFIFITLKTCLQKIAKQNQFDKVGNTILFVLFQLKQRQ